MATIRILLVDDHAIVREGVAAILNRQQDMAVVGEAENGQEAVALFGRLQPDVVVMDLRMPDMDGAEATAAIIADDPGAVVVLLTTFEGDDGITRALQAGAKAYVLKDASLEELLQVIRFWGVTSGRVTHLESGHRTAQEPGGVQAEETHWCRASTKPH